MIRLKCQAQHYGWGREASISEVACLLQAGGDEISESKPYAELWMGTHSNGPSTIAKSGEQLQQWLENHPFALGAVVRGRYGDSLPFLFKVLSVGTALSIQSHPDKRLAEILHAENPEAYKDDNHKPEMAIALTPFTALCGFARHEEIRECLRGLPELGLGVGMDMEQLLYDYTGQQGLREAFTTLMTLKRSLVHKIVEKIVVRLKLEKLVRSLTEKEQLMLDLQQQWPLDIGILAVPFLNYVKLQPGQALYLAANEPHAYLSGELVECMATSDNVVRAGLTLKHRDTAVLCRSLSYNQGMPDVLCGDFIDGCTRVYRPPFDEFEVRVSEVQAEHQHTIRGHIGPSIWLVQQGSGHASCNSGHGHLPEVETERSLKRGEIFFIPACTDITLKAGNEKLVVFMAVCNQRLFVGDRTLNDLPYDAAVAESTLSSLSVQCA